MCFLSFFVSFFLPLFPTFFITFLCLSSSCTGRNIVHFDLLSPPELSVTPPVDFSSFPRWWPHSGISFPRRFPVWRMCFLDEWRLSEGGPVDFSYRAHHVPVRKTIPVCGRQRGKYWNSTSRMSNSRNSLENHVPPPGNRSKTAPSAMSYLVGKQSKLTWPTSPGSIVWRLRPVNKFSRWGWLF